MLKRILSCAALALTLAAGVASAQQFPTKPITLLIPFPPETFSTILRLTGRRCRRWGDSGASA